MLALVFNAALCQTFERLFPGSAYQMSLVEAYDSTLMVVYHPPDSQTVTAFMNLNYSGDSLQSVFYPNVYTSIDNIIRSIDGNYLTTGDYTGNDLFISKLNVNFDTIWTRKFQGFIPFFHPKIIELFDSSLMVVYVRYNGAFYGISKVLHADKNGNIIWVLDQGETHVWQDPNIVAKDSLAYTAINMGVLSKDSMLQLSCINANNGNFEWQRQFVEFSGNPNLPIRNIASSIALKDSFIYVAGTSIDTSNMKHQMLMKFDLIGNLIWKRTFSDGSFSKLIIANPNKIVCIGLASDTITLSSYNKDGQEIWIHNFRNAILNYVNNLIEVSDSGFAFVCESRDSLVKMYVVKTDSSGSLISTTSINQPGQSEDFINYHYTKNELTTYLSSNSIGKINLMLFDLQGRLIISRELSFGSNSIDISGLRINPYIVLYYCKNKLLKRFKFVNN